MWTIREILNRVFAFRRKVESGEAFTVSVDESVASGSKMQLLIINPSDSGKRVRIEVVEAGGTAKGKLYIYRNVDTSGVSGTALTPMNHDLSRDGGSIMNIQYLGVDAYDTSTLTPSIRRVIPGGSHVRAIGGALSAGELIKMDPGTNLLIEVINTSTSEAEYSIEVKWYEE